MWKRSQSGNIFFALFGAIALVGILGAGVMTFMKGPLSTSVKITRVNTAETQMALGAQVAVMAAANTASSGDCDSDGYVEPLEWRDAGASPKPTNGGLVPMSIGMSKKDPWGTEYGYCAWDHGTSGACDDETGAGDNPAERLAGATTGGAYSVVAIVSAGSDKTFTTTCRDFATADVNSDGDLLDAGDEPLVSKAAETDDDIIFTYTYDEATGASGGLWSIKSGDPGTAVIDKKIEASGVASLQGGVLLPDSSLITCDATTAGVMARNASGGIDICDGTGWNVLNGETSTFSTDTSVVCDASTEGQVRYNSATGLPEFCDGVAWRPFNVNVPNVNLVLTPNPAAVMNVDGLSNLDTTLCTGGWVCGAPQTFTLRNEGSLTSATISVSLTNTTNFVKTADTCNGTTLAAGISCTITLKPKANGNMTYTGNLQITADNNPVVVLQGTGSNFSCQAGQSEGGGIVAYCGLSSPQGTYNLVVTPGNCSASAIEPICDGGLDTLKLTWGLGGLYLDNLIPYEDTIGAEFAIDTITYITFAGTGSAPAIQHCDNLVYNGYDDWYLPAVLEMHNYVRPNFSAIGGFVSNSYWVGPYRGSNNSDSYYYSVSGSSWSTTNRNTSLYLRCARRHNIALPSASIDTNPDDVSFPFSVTTASGDRVTSNSVTITGFLQPVVATVTSSTGNPKLQVSTDGGATWGVESDTVNFTTIGWRLRLVMDAPVVGGAINTMTLTVGPDSYTWNVGYADSTDTVYAFVTSTSYKGSFGGVAGADSQCQSSATAAGYSGTWKAILSSSTLSAGDRISFNWGTLKRLDDVVIANGWNDLWDGSIQNPINISEALQTVTSGYVHSGTTSAGGIGATYANLCNDWTAGVWEKTYLGQINATGSQWISYGAADNCGASATYRLYCISSGSIGTDTTPSVPASTDDFKYAIQVPLSTLVTSNSVAVTGLGSGVAATVTITGSDGSPGFETSTDGGSTWNPGTSGVTTVQNGHQIRLFMTSAPTGSTSYLMTVEVGSGPVVKWRVWTGWDGVGSGIKRVFIYNAGQPRYFGGLVGADSKCQTAASGASLGGTWKAILSDDITIESDWARNRVGYNWTQLQRIDGQTVAYAPYLWETATQPFLNPINLTASGVDVGIVNASTNSSSTGKAVRENPCVDWTGGSGVSGYDWGYGKSTGTGTTWTEAGIFASWDHCGSSTSAPYLYCIEQ